MAASTPPSATAPGSQGTPPPPRRLYRRTDDKVIGGVASGIANYIGVDVTVVRLAAVLLAFAGPGVIAYIVAWILMPAAPPGTPRNPGAGGPALTGAGPVLGVVLVVVGAVALLGKVIWWDAQLLFPLTLLAIGAVLLLRPRLDPPAGPTTEAPGPATPAPAPTAPGGGEGAEETLPSPPAPEALPAGPATAESTEAGPERSPLDLFVAGLALVVAGTAWVLAATDTVALSLGDVLAALLVLVGAGLVVGAWWGRARWLIAIAVPLALVLAMASLVDFPFRHGFGRRTHLPESLRQVRDEYRLGVGELLVDLSGVDVPPGRTVRVQAQVGIGSLRMIVPDDAAVHAEAHAHVGQVRMPDGQGADGTGAEQTWSRSGNELSGRVELDLEAGLGEVSLDRG